MGQNEAMNTTAINRLAEMLNVEPHEPTILIRLNPAGLSSDCLLALQGVAEPTGQPSDSLRLQIASWVAAENARRLGDESAEAAAWILNWHAMNDRQLQFALAASFSWLQMPVSVEVTSAVIEIHRAVVTAACARLGELHDAIEG